jgi:hypothetical protein
VLHRAKVIKLPSPCFLLLQLETHKQREKEGLTRQWRWRRRRRRWKWWSCPENVLISLALVFFICSGFSFSFGFFVPLFSGPFFFGLYPLFLRSPAFYRLSCYLSSQDRDKASKISFANWVLVGLGCRCFNISIPSLQAGFQRPRKKKRNNACLKWCVLDWKWPFSIWSCKFQHFNRAPRQNFSAFYKMVPGP